MKAAEIESRIHKTPTCWIWLGAHDSGGYSRVRWEGKNQLAHRVVWEMLYGPIPLDLEMDHLCRNPGCVNPAHLEAVTHGENMRRGEGVGGGCRTETGRTVCPKGHDLTLPNARVNLYTCRVCKNEKMRERRKKSKK